MSTAASGWWAQHGVHAITIAGPVLVFALVGLGADAHALWKRRRELASRWSPLHVAAALSVGAASVHLGVCPEHFREGLLYGAFFAGASTAQFAWSALALTRRRLPWLAAAGLCGNASLVMLWAVTRTLGIPLGPGAGEVERVGLLDILATACELGVMAMCVVAILARRRHSGGRDRALGVSTA